MGFSANLTSHTGREKKEGRMGEKREEIREGGRKLEKAGRMHRKPKGNVAALARQNSFFVS